MRRAILSSVILVTLVMLAGCTLNKDFSFDIEKSFAVSSTNLTDYSNMQIIDPTSNSDFNNNKDHISAINVTSATYTITSATVVPGQVVTAKLGVADANGLSPALLVPFTPFTIAVDATGSLPVDNTVANQLSAWLKASPNKAQITLTAHTTVAQTNFVVNIKLHVTATYTASIL